MSCQMLCKEIGCLPDIFYCEINLHLTIMTSVKIITNNDWLRKMKKGHHKKDKTLVVSGGRSCVSDEMKATLAQHGHTRTL